MWLGGTWPLNTVEHFQESFLCRFRNSDLSSSNPIQNIEIIGFGNR